MQQQKASHVTVVKVLDPVNLGLSHAVIGMSHWQSQEGHLAKTAFMHRRSPNLSKS